MKPYLTTLLSGLSLSFCLLLSATASRGQDSASRHMIRIYEDNDLIKVFGDISDKGYTNGTRLDYYYVKSHDSRFFLDKLMPKAGAQSVNTFGWSLMQVMFTPEDLKATEPDVSDWPYTGALVLSHSLHSSNPVKKYNLQTELVGGVMGKASMAEQLQKGIHKLIKSDEPMGWDKQYPTDVLLNLNITLEKMLWHYKGVLEVMGGGQAMLGTMLDGAAVYGQIRVGKMLPYFDGLISQYARPFRQKNKLQCYLIARPSLEWMGYNAVIEGGVFNGKSDYYKEREQRVSSNRSISRRLDLGLVLGYGNVSLSFTQRIMPRLVDGLNHERLGNISLHVGW